jgi:hypothetical protein
MDDWYEVAKLVIHGRGRVKSCELRGGGRPKLEGDELKRSVRIDLPVGDGNLLS